MTRRSPEDDEKGFPLPRVFAAWERARVREIQQVRICDGARVRETQQVRICEGGALCRDE